MDASDALGWLERLAAQAQAARQSISDVGAGGPSPVSPTSRSEMMLQALARTRARVADDFGGGHFEGDGHNHGGGRDAGGVNPEFKRRLDALIKASGGRLSVGNDYRSTTRQAQLFAAAVKKYGSVAAARKWVAPPGRSKHNHGLAADLRGDLALARRLAAQFGLHFPMGHEPWHIEMRGSRG